MSSLTGIGQGGLAGVQAGMQGLRSNAHSIANANSQSQSSAEVGVTEALVDTVVNRQQVEVSAKTIQAEDSMIGTLLDVRA